MTAPDEHPNHSRVVTAIDQMLRRLEVSAAEPQGERDPPPVASYVGGYVDAVASLEVISEVEAIEFKVRIYTMVFGSDTRPTARSAGQDWVERRGVGSFGPPSTPDDSTETEP